MNEQELAEIEARAEAATGGFIEAVFIHTSKFPQGQWNIQSITGTEYDHETETIAELFSTEEDVQFYAHARQDVPALCAELRRLNDRVKELETSILDSVLKQLETITQNDLQAENARLRNTLEWYANPDNWINIEWDGNIYHECDGGLMASDALKGGAQ